MKNPKIYLILIIFIAVILRFYQLGNVPPSPDWDEAALAYNAHSIFTTGRDEYGTVLPVVLRSFNDYKPALYTYLTIPFVELIGMTTFAVRLPSAIMGIIAVIATYFLVKELFTLRTIKDETSTNFPEILALLTAFLLAISPWHIQFSRVAFEANVGLTFNILLVLFFIKGLKNHWMLLPAAFFAGLNPSVYQSERVFTPLLVFALIVVFRKELFTISKKYLVTAFIIGLLTVLPLILFIATDQNALERVKGTSVFNNQIEILKQASQRLQRDKENHDLVGQIFDNRRFVFAKNIEAGYLSHFDLNWLFISGDITRHHAPGMGLVYITFLPFLFIGIYLLLFEPYDKKTKYIIFAWFLLAPVPASITTGVPHAVRTLNFLPIFEIFIALGLLKFVFSLNKLKNRFLTIPVKYLAAAICSLIFIFNFIYYLNQYFVQQNYAYAYDWQYGYEQAVPAAEQLKGSYKKVLVNDREPLSQSYIFFLFYTKYPPVEYQRITLSGKDMRNVHQFDKYEFRTFEWDKEFKKDDVLLIGGEQDFPLHVIARKTISFPNGKPAILIVDPKDNQ
jgi:4-amino-4-deoxy-L-arabinose transferase-like glycosyltransferase